MRRPYLSIDPNLVSIALGALAMLTASARAAELTVEPSSIDLRGSRAAQRLTVSLTHGAAHIDVTGKTRFESSDPNIVEVDSRGVARARGDGSATIVAIHGEHRSEAEVTVAEAKRARPILFRTEVNGALSRGGCSQGACHGSPQGKNGFRLSLRGFDPALDLHTLTREDYGRRTDTFDPDQSLILLKASGRVAHQGGVRFRSKDPVYQLLRQWVLEGRRDHPAPSLQRLELLPGGRQLQSGHPRQQLVARAHYDDGSVQDVTHLAVFSTANDRPASVTDDGLVEFYQTGETAVLVRYLDQIQTARLRYIQRDPEFKFVSPPQQNFVDGLVFAKQRQLQLNPSSRAGDSEFLRRVYLDLIGGIPTPAEARRFLDSSDPRKREQLIDELLERDEYAFFWAMKWADVMRGNREAITQRGVHNFHRYLVRLIADDRPFDLAAREILTSMGNTINTPAANFYRIARTPNEAAEAFSQLFLGVRIQCAKCHNHPYESITQRDYYGLAAHFSRVRLKGKRFGLDKEVVYLARTGEVRMPGAEKDLPPLAFGVETKASLEGDRRSGLAAWLTTKDNRYFARSTVNRIWAHVMAHGIVEPVDDFRDSNPPSNPELLDALAREFTNGGFRFKPVLRAILNSSVYQLTSASTPEQSSLSADPRRYFTQPVVRMLGAEQILDAISTATDVPEEFGGYPRGVKAIALAEGAVEHKFLQAFTKPVRDVACDCARETDPSLNQAVHLLNNPDLLRKIDSPKSRLGRWLEQKKPTDEIIELVFLATLSRRPKASEVELARRHIKQCGSAREGLQDLQHALINSNEFLLRH